MKKNEIEVGKVYAVRIGGNTHLSPVRIDAFHDAAFSRRRQRFEGTNLHTGKKIFGTAARCRHLWPEAK